MAELRRSCFVGALSGLLMASLAACSGGSASSEIAQGLINIGNLCTDRFNPAFAASGEDCKPVYNRFCPASAATLPFNQTEVDACDGVSSSTGSVSVGGETSSYVIVRPASGGRSGLYVALHWAGANGETMVNRMRLSELAKGRDVTVVAPTAPGESASWGYDTAPAVIPIETRMLLLDAIISAAQQQTGVAGPVLVSGVSGGGVMAFVYGCERAEHVVGVEIVAAEVAPTQLSACAPARALASVQVHGTLDAIAPYQPLPVLAAGPVPIFEHLLASNGCDANRLSTVQLPSPEALVSGIEVRWAPRSACTSSVGSALVTIQGGGHNWPGFDDPLNLGLGANAYGPISTGFDATLQGYDLLRYLAG